MPLTIRPYEDRDRDGFYSVSDLTYNNGDVTPMEKRQLKNRKGFVAEDNGEVQGIFSVVDFGCTREGRADLRCAGIAGVAVAPAFRHLGVGSAMMRWSIPFLRSEGYQIASLYAFREPFYRKFGYEVCGERLEIEVPSHRLPKLAPELPVRLIDWQDHAEVTACQEAYARRYSGMNVRNDMHWGRVLDEKKKIYAVGDPVEAYAIVQHSWEFWVPQWINEVAWSTVRGYKSLIAVLSQICINKTSLKWFDASDSPYLQMYTDQGIVSKSARPVMYRVLDVPGVISALSSKNPGSFTMEVKDELIPENAGCWRVEDNGSHVGCERTGSADLYGDIQAWTVAYMGDPGVERGVIEERTPGALAAAAKVLSPSRAYCQEFF